MRTFNRRMHAGCIAPRTAIRTIAGRVGMVRYLALLEVLDIIISWQER
jgi:hypothetical protein